MAKVWFARRRRAQWVVPGGKPAFEMPLSDLIFKLDLGRQRWTGGVRPSPAPELPAEPATALEKVFVETTPEDLVGHTFSLFQVGFYDSPFPPEEAARRLSKI